MRRKNVTIVGNCQASALAELYRDFVGLPNLENVAYFNDHGLPQDAVRAGVAGADLIIVQERDFNHGLAPEQLPPGVEVRPFPMVLAGYIWPYANEPHIHNQPEPPFSDGPYPSQLSDSHLNRLIARGVSPEAALEQYLALDVARVASVDRVFELYQDRQRQRDAKTGFDLAPVIEAEFRGQSLFRSPHHPNLPLFGVIAAQLFELLHVPAETIRLALASLRTSPFPPDELPIHPGIARHFGLAYADADTRYTYFGEGRFTFAEYVLRYMRYENDRGLRIGTAMALGGGDANQALALLDAGLANVPGSISGLRARALMLDRVGRGDEAIGAFRQAVEADPADLESLVALADALAQHGDGAGAEAAARRALAIAPDHAPAHAALAHAALAAGDPRLALAAAREAARLVPGHLAYRRLCGLALMRDGDLPGAQEAARHAVAMDPLAADSRNLLAEIFEEEGRRAEAIAVLEEGLALDCRNGQTFSLLGNFHLRNRDLAAAEAAFARGVEIEPGRADLEECRAAVHGERLAGDPSLSEGRRRAEMGAGVPAVPPAAPKPARPAPPKPLDLIWLPPVEDWPARIGAIERLVPGDADAWDRLVALAGTRLDFVRLGRLDRSLLRLFGDAPPPGLTTRPVRLAVLGASTVSHLFPAIRVAALRRGLWVTLYEPDYGQYRAALLDPASALHAFAPTAILLALDAPHLLRNADPMFDEAGADAALGETIGELRGLWRMAREAFRCQIVQQTALPVFPTLLGLNEHRLPGSPAAMAPRLNAMLRDAARDEGIDLLSLDARAAQEGIGAWHDPMLWHRAKQEVTPLAAPLYGEMVARLIGAAQGRAAKCLVLDLDNTLWGGVIGDDGLEGIVIGQGSAPGEAFAAFQSYAVALARRGVILAVCSKNDEANALAAFDAHPEMVLKRADFSAFVANWSDKAANLRAIAATLGIGLDALVFADDNPFERALIRRELPMVAVPELPDDPALFARCLSDAGYFEGLAITAEDRARTGQYRANRQRATMQASATDMDAYLASLDMVLAWRPFDRTGLHRVTQLINKTNQFNLTTIRYGEDEVAAVMDDPRAFGVQLRLADRFGDNGIIAVVIGRMIDVDTLHLDTWLMSCRVLGRRVEQATLAVVVARAGALGAKRIVGEYRPSPKNGMVADHYARLGFATAEAGRFVLELADWHAADPPMTIVRE